VLPVRRSFALAAAGAGCECREVGQGAVVALPAARFGGHAICCAYAPRAGTELSPAVLRERLAGSDEWDEFGAAVEARLILDGLGNEDEFQTDHAGGFTGMSFRFFDPVQRRWSIYWADSRRPGVLDPPVFGAFAGDVGVFEGPDSFAGRPILVRFTWTG